MTQPSAMTGSEPSRLTLAAHVLADHARRAVKRAVRPLWMRQLQAINRRSSDSVVAPGGPVVSLTTHAKRLETVFYAIESIGRGRLLPSRLILWLDEQLLARGLPESLQRLQGRGLEVIGCVDCGPHTKYLPQVLSDPLSSRPLVTADDDQIYPRYWLQQLTRAYQAEPSLIHCYRAKRIGLTEDGSLAPYQRWSNVRSISPSHLHFATGVSGVIYPPAMQLALGRLGLAFLGSCPRADDIWLNAVALWEGIPVRQIVPTARPFYEIPGSRAQGLARQNTEGGGNDVQLRATYRAEDLARLRALAGAGSA